jgi:hypothetical protein
MGKGAKAPTTNPFPLNFAKPLWRFAPMGVLCILHKVAGPVAASATGIFIIPRRRKFVKPFLQNKFFYFFS